MSQTALLPSSERQRIELIKQAHLLVWRRRRNGSGVRLWWPPSMRWMKSTVSGFANS